MDLDEDFGEVDSFGGVAGVVGIAGVDFEAAKEGGKVEKHVAAGRAIERVWRQTIREDEAMADMICRLYSLDN